MKKSMYRKAAEIVHKENKYSCYALHDAGAKLLKNDYDIYIKYFEHDSYEYLGWWNDNPFKFDNKLNRTLALLLMDEMQRNGDL